VKKEVLTSGLVFSEQFPPFSNAGRPYFSLDRTADSFSLMLTGTDTITSLSSSSLATLVLESLVCYYDLPMILILSPTSRLSALTLLVHTFIQPWNMAGRADLLGWQ